MGCGKKCATFLLIVFNIIFWLTGIALIVVGAVYVADSNLFKIQKVIIPNDPLFTNVAYGLIGVGCFIFLIGFCGLFGAIKKSPCLLGIYIAFVVIVMAAELGCGIYIAVKKNAIEKEMKTTLMNFIEKDYPPESSTTSTGANNKQAVDYVQQLFKCCGVSSPSDWINTAWYKNKTLFDKGTYKTPYSCCKTVKADDAVIYLACQTSINYYQTGCVKGAEKWIQDKFPVIIGVACGIAALQIFGLIFAIVVCRQEQKEEYA